MSQSAILENHTILKATEVEFPPKPSVSNEAKVSVLSEVGNGDSDALMLLKCVTSIAMT